MRSKKKDSCIPAPRFHLLTLVYDLVVRGTTRERHFKRALVEQAAIPPDQRVLALACGALLGALRPLSAGRLLPQMTKEHQLS
jgi:hypothetical protein